MRQCSQPHWGSNCLISCLSIGREHPNPRSIALQRRSLIFFRGTCQGESARVGPPGSRIGSHSCFARDENGRHLDQDLQDRGDRRRRLRARLGCSTTLHSVRVNFTPKMCHIFTQRAAPMSTASAPYPLLSLSHTIPKTIKILIAHWSRQPPPRGRGPWTHRLHRDRRYSLAMARQDTEVLLPPAAAVCPRFVGAGPPGCCVWSATII